MTMGSADRSPVAPEGSWNDGPVGMLTRLVLVLLGLLLLWSAHGRYQDWRDDYASSFRSDVGLWVAYVAIVVLAGAALGLAVVLPARIGGYRWGLSLVLALPPLALLTLGSLWEVRAVREAIPGELLEVVAGSVVLPVTAFMVGVAVAAGFADHRAD